MVDDQKWQVIVVGAGAAGLFAAAESAKRGKRTLLIEKNTKLGVKILMSGGTRCNITHDADWQTIATTFGKQQERFLKFPLASFQPEQVVNFFNRQGIETKVESTGKVFPVSDRAVDVRDALVDYARTSGVTIMSQTPVQQIEKKPYGFRILTEQNVFLCQSLVVTVGGQSYPGCGTTGDGYQWMKQLGHTIVSPRPALTPIRVKASWVRELSGVTISDVLISVRLDSDRTPIQKTNQERSRYRGSFLFTHTGCSGPPVLNVSRIVTDPANNLSKQLVCDWLPEFSEQRLRAKLSSPDVQRGGKHLLGWLTNQIPKRLSVAICDLAQTKPQQVIAELDRRQLNSIIQNLKSCRMDIDGTLGFAKAEVTAGGVFLNEVDNKTMASKVVKGLFVAGEILDVDGPIGGYNFQAAFSTGRLAGQNA